ncbi:MAG: VacJ family lipoprotein [Rhodospirillales bacterium]|nr:VacJ family lipoprotein [Rhodospirillales bacterium]MCB9996139.1 VacJ family lipoprotein [Rhodospirillales bacterium]
MKDQSKKSGGVLTLCLAAFMCLMIAGCTTNPQTADGEIYDPLEDMNRSVFEANDALDQAVARPIAQAYRSVTPKLVRESVRNFLRNLRTPINMANNILQGDIEGAAGDLSRFVMNTSIGIGGLFDVAADTGLEYEHEDFGQTLGVWGIAHGPYLVLPVIGPSSFRDATGILVDTFADPVRLYLYNTDQEEWYYARVVATGIDKREELLDALDDLRANSFDYYAAIRSAYMQKREAMLRDDDPDAVVAPAIPDYDEEF